MTDDPVAPRYTELHSLSEARKGPGRPPGLSAALMPARPAIHDGQLLEVVARFEAGRLRVKQNAAGTTEVTVRIGPEFRRQVLRAMDYADGPVRVTVQVPVGLDGGLGSAPGAKRA